MTKAATKQADTIRDEFASVMAKKAGRILARDEHLWRLRTRARHVHAHGLTAEIEVEIGELLLKIEASRRSGSDADWDGVNIPSSDENRFRKLARERRKQIAAEHELAKHLRREAVSQRERARHAANPTHPSSQPFITVVSKWTDDRGFPTRFITAVEKVEYDERIECAPVVTVRAQMIDEALADLAKRDLEARIPKPPPEKPPGGRPIVDDGDDDDERDARRKSNKGRSGLGGVLWNRARRKSHKRAA